VHGGCLIVFSVSVMGPTGAGKSTVSADPFFPCFQLILTRTQLIDVATGQNGHTVGHRMESHTSDIRAVRVSHPLSDHPTVFVDTPGFDDTYKSDTEILSIIANWLVTT
jgi:predicted GTPase